MSLNLELTEQDVLDAVAAMVAAFGDSRTEDYFACFDETATFVFYYEPDRLENRAQYEKVWQGWLADGLKVTRCESTNQLIQRSGATALFIHDVETDMDDNGKLETRLERETIVFARFPDGSVRAIHEHLSERPSENR